MRTCNLRGHCPQQQSSARHRMVLCRKLLPNPLYRHPRCRTPQPDGFKLLHLRLHGARDPSSLAKAPLPKSPRAENNQDLPKSPYLYRLSPFVLYPRRLRAVLTYKSSLTLSLRYSLPRNESLPCIYACACPYNLPGNHIHGFIRSREPCEV